MAVILEKRQKQIFRKGLHEHLIECEKSSTPGAVSQRACTFCGSRVVLYPIADALHLVHGPIGCAAYTWDIRGSRSSGPELFRLSFSTDLEEKDIVFGGEPKLYRSLIELIDKHQPQAAFVYNTCIVGVIGDDVVAICRKVAAEKGIPVIPVNSEGFKGSKKEGYREACKAISALVGTASTTGIGQYSINILGDFNLAGEIWIIKDYFRKIGIEVVATMTGDGRIADIQRAHGAALNVVQCSGSMIHLAKTMQQEYGIPFMHVSYFGISDMASALYEVAGFFKSPVMMHQAERLVSAEVDRIYPQLMEYKEALNGKKAAIYVGGAFKALSLVRALRVLGMEIVMVGSQTGNSADYRELKELCNQGTIIVDDTNPLELSAFLTEKEVDLFIGGVKERPIAYKLGIGFCDHNHERKIPLAGFVGMENFAREVYATVTSPVWQFVQPRATKGSDNE